MMKLIKRYQNPDGGIDYTKPLRIAVAGTTPESTEVQVLPIITLRMANALAYSEWSGMPLDKALKLQDAVATTRPVAVIEDADKRDALKKQVDNAVAMDMRKAATGANFATSYTPQQAGGFVAAIGTALMPYAFRIPYVGPLAEGYFAYEGAKDFYEASKEAPSLENFGRKMLDLSMLWPAAKRALETNKIMNALYDSSKLYATHPLLNPYLLTNLNAAKLPNVAWAYNNTELRVETLKAIEELYEQEISKDPAQRDLKLLLILRNRHFQIASGDAFIYKEPQTLWHGSIRGDLGELTNPRNPKYPVLMTSDNSRVAAVYKYNPNDAYKLYDYTDKVGGLYRLYAKYSRPKIIDYKGAQFTGGGSYQIFKDLNTGEVLKTGAKNTPLHLESRGPRNEEAIEYLLYSDQHPNGVWRRLKDLTLVENVPVRVAEASDYEALHAFNQGHDAIILKNIKEPGGLGTDYIFFNYNKIKSADPITRDVNGNIIPLNLRDNFKVNNIRFSIGGKLKLLTK